MEVECIYEKGVLKPLEKLDLEEGKIVYVKIEKKVDIRNLKGKYRGKIDKKKFLELIDEIHDRRTHLH